MSHLCSDCGRRVLWAMTARNTPLLVDAEPSPTGKIELVREDGVLRAVLRLRGPVPKGARMHHSHFKTCPATK